MTSKVDRHRFTDLGTPNRGRNTMPGGSTPTDVWWLYVLLCANDRLYVGIARDVDLRFEVHRTGKGAFFTRLNAPVRILARQAQPSRSAALMAEYSLKQQTRQQKLSWVAALTDAADAPALPNRKSPAPRVVPRK